MNISLRDETDAVTEDGYTWITLKASAAIAAGACVQLDNSKSGDAQLKYVKTALASAVGQAFAIGFALDAAAAADDLVRVVIHGYMENASVDDGTAEGPIVQGTGTAGLTVANSASITSPILALNIGTPSSDKSTVYVLNPLGLPLS